MQTRNRKVAGFTLIELLVVISIIALLIGILLPALGAARRTARQLQNSTQLRGIHQGMVTFAQGNKSGGGQGYFPGMDSRGNVITNDAVNNGPNDDYTGAGSTGGHPAERFALMLNQDIFTPDYIINPNDAFQAVSTSSNNGGTADTDVSPENYSYGMLAIGTGGEAPDSPNGVRQQEWSETLNTQAVVISDRAIGGTTEPAIHSTWTDQDSSDWRGSITRNDNSTGFETEFTLETQYANRPTAPTDNIFEPGDVGTGDLAYMVYSGPDSAN